MKRFKMDKFFQIPMFQEPADGESRWSVRSPFLILMTIVMALVALPTGSGRPIAGIQRTEWPSPKGTLLVGILAGVTAAFSLAILNLGLLEFTYPLNGEYQ
jgi:hypothetical protein